LNAVPKIFAAIWKELLQKLTKENELNIRLRPKARMIKFIM